MNSPPSAVGSGPRYDRLDALRGLAMVWMAGFHFSFDLNNYHLLQPLQNFYADPFWTLQRIAIVSLFLLCAGLGQSTALAACQGWPRFWKRWGRIVGCALLVSAGSAIMFPHSWISFGVLHGMAVMLILARLAWPLGGWLWPVGALAIALPVFVQHPFFDHRLTDWVGLVTHKPITEDYVPVMPWLGLMLWGLAAGDWLRAHQPSLLAGPLPRALRALAALGRWPLSFYMLHQPVLIGAILAWRSMH
jgi:uncharacterized membrane protein